MRWRRASGRVFAQPLCTSDIMVTIRHGYTFAQNETPTAANLNALVDNASVTDIVTANLASGLTFVNLSQPGSPSQGDSYVGSDGLLYFYDGTSWNRASGWISLINKSGGTILAGTPVVPFKGGFDDTQAAAGTADISVLGVLLADTNNGVAGTVITKGIASVRVLPHTTVSFSPGDYVACGDTDNPDAALPVLATQVRSPTTLNYELAGFGILQESVAADATQTVVSKKCIIFK